MFDDDDDDAFPRAILGNVDDVHRGFAAPQRDRLRIEFCSRGKFALCLEKPAPEALGSGRSIGGVSRGNVVRRK